MKKIIIMILVVLTLTLSLVGCAEAPTTTTPETTVDNYPYYSGAEAGTNYLRLVYQENKIYFYVNTLDDSVWVSFHGNSFTPYTIDGKTVYWKGSFEATFQKPVTE